MVSMLFEFTSRVGFITVIAIFILSLALVPTNMGAEEARLKLIKGSDGHDGLVRLSDAQAANRTSYYDMGGDMRKGIWDNWIRSLVANALDSTIIVCYYIMPLAYAVGDTMLKYMSVDMYYDVLYYCSWSLLIFPLVFGYIWDVTRWFISRLKYIAAGLIVGVLIERSSHET